MEMYLNVCANYSSTAWVMRLPDHLSWAGIREWGMCHILFRQPDAVCILVEVSQLLLSLSVRLMLLNGSTPPAVNWLGKFLGGYHDDNWHLCFAPWQIEVIWRDSTLTSYLRRHSCHGYTNRQILSALSHPSMQFSRLEPSIRSNVHMLMPKNSGAKRRAQRVLASFTHPSPLGFTYPSPARCRNPLENKKAAHEHVHMRKYESNAINEFSTPH